MSLSSYNHREIKNIAKQVNAKIRAEHKTMVKAALLKVRTENKERIARMRVRFAAVLKKKLVPIAGRTKANLIEDLSKHSGKVSGLKPEAPKPKKPKKDPLDEIPPPPKEKKLTAKEEAEMQKTFEEAKKTPLEGKPQYITKRIGGKIRRIPVKRLDEAAAKKKVVKKEEMPKKEFKPKDPSKKDPEKKEPVKVKSGQVKKIRKIVRERRQGKKSKFTPSLEKIKEISPHINIKTFEEKEYLREFHKKFGKDKNPEPLKDFYVDSQGNKRYFRGMGGGGQETAFFVSEEERNKILADKAAKTKKEAEVEKADPLSKVFQSFSNDKRNKLKKMIEDDELSSNKKSQKRAFNIVNDINLGLSADLTDENDLEMFEEDPEGLKNVRLEQMQSAAELKDILDDDDDTTKLYLLLFKKRSPKELDSIIMNNAEELLKDYKQLNASQLSGLRSYINSFSKKEQSYLLRNQRDAYLANVASIKDQTGQKAKLVKAREAKEQKESAKQKKAFEKEQAEFKKAKAQKDIEVKKAEALQAKLARESAEANKKFGLSDVKPKAAKSASGQSSIKLTPGVRVSDDDIRRYVAKKKFKSQKELASDPTVKAVREHNANIMLDEAKAKYEKSKEKVAKLKTNPNLKKTYDKIMKEGLSVLKAKENPSTKNEKQSLAIYYRLLSDFNSVYVDDTLTKKAIIDPQWEKHTKKEIEDFKKLG